MKLNARELQKVMDDVEEIGSREDEDLYVGQGGKIVRRIEKIRNHLSEKQENYRVYANSRNKHS